MLNSDNTVVFESLPIYVLVFIIGLNLLTVMDCTLIMMLMINLPKQRGVASQPEMIKCILL